MQAVCAQQRGEMKTVSNLQMELLPSNLHCGHSQFLVLLFVLKPNQEKSKNVAIIPQNS